MRHFLETVRQGLLEGKAKDVHVAFGTWGERDAKVWVNPSHNDLMVLVGRYGEVRGCNSIVDNTTYIWDANVAVHFTMKRAIWRSGLTDMGDSYDVERMPIWADFYVAHSGAVSHDWSDNFNLQIAPDVLLFMNSEVAYQKTCKNESFQRMVGPIISVD